MAIADSCHLWAEVERLKTQVLELRSTSRVAQEEVGQMTKLVMSCVTRSQLDAALSTKVSPSQVDTQMDTLRSEVATLLDQKADATSLTVLQSTKLDISVFDANVWDVNKLRVSLEQHVHDLFATFAAHMERQVSTKLAIQDFNRVFHIDTLDQKESLETAALRLSTMMDQLEACSNYMKKDQQRQNLFAELDDVDIEDIAQKQTAVRNSILQLESAKQATTVQLQALNEQTSQAMANVGLLTEKLNHLQAKTQADKKTQEATQTQLAYNMKHLETQGQYLAKTMSEFEHFAHARLADSFDTKLKMNNDKVRNEFNEVKARQRQQEQLVIHRMSKTDDQVLDHKERLAQLDASMRKLAGLFTEIRGDVNNVRGPLLTLATNLHEENVAVLREIERSQDDTRNIMLDYQNLLEKEKHFFAANIVPSRPSSSPFTAAGRKLRQHVSKTANRPHTSSQQVRVGNRLNQRSAGAFRNSKSHVPSSEGFPYLSGLPNSDDDVKDSAVDFDQVTRVKTPVKSSRNNVPSSFYQQVAGLDTDDFFHFPQTENGTDT